MSEQITEVLPRVSTAGSFRMMALRAAMRDTPIARIIVTAAGRPSGMAPTVRATAAMNMSMTGWPLQMPARKVTPPSRRMATISHRLKAAIFRVRGVSRVAASEIRAEMRPISVFSPVATTTPVPCP